MHTTISKKIVSIAVAFALAAIGATAMLAVHALAPAETGLTQQALATVTTQKKTFWRGETATWKFYGVKVSKLKLKSSNKKVCKLTKKGKITAVKAGKATLTAKRNGKTIAKYKITVKEATKFIRTWKLSSASIDGQYFSTTDVEDGVLDGSISFKKGGKVTLKLKGYNEDGEPINMSNTGTWTALSKTYAHIGKDETATISGSTLYVNADGVSLTFVK